MSCKSGLLPIITKFSEILTDKIPHGTRKMPTPKKKAPQTSWTSSAKLKANLEMLTEEK